MQHLSMVKADFASLRERFETRWRLSRGGDPAQGQETVYAFGDVHGRVDLLRPMLDAITADARATFHFGRPLVIGLGDYIDRGPESREVIEQLVRLRHEPFVQTRFVMGNHEEILLDFLRDAGVGARWCLNGGADTLRSYGVEFPSGQASKETWEQVQAAFRAAVTGAHRRFYEALEVSVTLSGHHFVHAGVRPGVPLAEQTRADALWIREPFLSADLEFDRVVVHGHTPIEEPSFTGGRIGLDTGAYATGVLSGVKLSRCGVRVIQVRSSGGDPSPSVSWLDRLNP